jgi:hypothetical protein
MYSTIPRSPGRPRAAHLPKSGSLWLIEISIGSRVSRRRSAAVDVLLVIRSDSTDCLATGRSGATLSFLAQCVQYFRAMLVLPLPRPWRGQDGSGGPPYPSEGQMGLPSHCPQLYPMLFLIVCLDGNPLALTFMYIPSHNQALLMFTIDTIMTTLTTISQITSKRKRGSLAKVCKLKAERSRKI